MNMDINNIKEIKVFTPNGEVAFNTVGLNKIEGYGKYQKNKISKIVNRIINKVGILAYQDNNEIKKIDLTMQVMEPQIIFNDNAK